MIKNNKFFFILFFQMNCEDECLLRSMDELAIKSPSKIRVLCNKYKELKKTLKSTKSLNLSLHNRLVKMKDIIRENRRMRKELSISRNQIILLESSLETLIKEHDQLKADIISDLTPTQLFDDDVESFNNIIKSL